MARQAPAPVNRRAFLGSAAAAAAVVAAGSQVARAAEPPAGSVKIIALSGSLRKGKGTSKALEIALEAARSVSPAIATELIELSKMNLDPYVAVKDKSVEKEDDFPALAAKLTAPDVFGIILGSPVYMGIVSSPLKSLMERMVAFRSGGANGFPLRNKVGGALAVGAGRNAGVELVLTQQVLFLLSQDLVVVGDGKPTSHWGGTVWSQGDDVTKDEGGLATVRGMGRRVAETALRMAATAGK